MDLNAPPAVLDIARTLDRHGFQAWAVGGAVRDAVAGLPGGDWDFATDARPDDLRRIFRRTVPIGIEHGTVGVHGRDGVLYEVTTFRLDVETFGRHAVVRFADTLEEDLSRRDFTINAVAWNPITREVRDPYSGIPDFAHGMLRTVGEPERRFAEDYLRILRALRFAGHFDLRIEVDTWAALSGAAGELARLSAERIREELIKVLGKTRRASRALRLYADSGAMKVILPEVGQTAEVQLDDGDDALSLALRTVDAIPVTRTTLRLAALFHTAGYPGARARDLRGGWRYTGHERIAARKTEEALRRLKASNRDVDEVCSLVAMQSDLFPPDAPDAGIRRWLAHVTPARVADLFRFRVARFRAKPTIHGERDIVGRWRKTREVLRQNPVLGLGGLAIDGNDLLRAGIEPGPGMGAILQRLLDRVIEEPDLNDPETLLEIAREVESP